LVFPQGLNGELYGFISSAYTSSQKGREVIVWGDREFVSTIWEVDKILVVEYITVIVGTADEGCIGVNNEEVEAFEDNVSFVPFSRTAELTVPAMAIAMQQRY
jgi:hypothetical protein